MTYEAARAAHQPINRRFSNRTLDETLNLTSPKYTEPDAPPQQSNTPYLWVSSRQERKYHGRAYFGVRIGRQSKCTRNPKNPKDWDDEQYPTGYDRHSEQICICSPNLNFESFTSNTSHLDIVQSDLGFLHVVIHNNVRVFRSPPGSVVGMMGTHGPALWFNNIVTCHLFLQHFLFLQRRTLHLRSLFIIAGPRRRSGLNRCTWKIARPEVRRIVTWRTRRHRSGMIKKKECG